MPDSLDASADPHVVAAIAEVQRTFTEWRAASTKVARSSKPASLAAARRAESLAERAYREASDRRDELVEIRNARMTQRGDERGALWSRPDDGGDAPVVGRIVVNGSDLGPAVRHSDGRIESGPHIDAAEECPHCGAWHAGKGHADVCRKLPSVKLPNAELQRAVDALREAGVLHATVKLSDKRVLIFRGGPFGSVEITKP